jgi:hypothetical protein
MGYTAVLTLVAAGLVLGGCGGGSSNKSSTTESSSSAPNTGPADSSSPDSTDSAAKPSGIPKIADQTWSTGRIHVELSGDKSANFESDGSGATLGGVTSAAFAQNVPNVASIGLGGGEESAISLTAGGVSTVGGFSTKCSISFTKNDDAGLAADFACDGLDAVATSSTDAFKVNVKGHFTLTR